VEGTRSGVSPIQLFPVRGNPVSPGKSSSLTAASNSDNAIVTIENRDNSSIFKHMIFSTLDALLSSSLPNRKKKRFKSGLRGVEKVFLRKSDEAQFVACEEVTKALVQRPILIDIIGR